jgi:hypothetical protein
VVDEFILEDLRQGRINLMDLPWVSRQLARLGLLLNFAMLGVLLSSDQLRALFELRPALNPVPGRGQLIPVVLFPLSLFLLSLAWTYALRGSITAHAWIRAGVLALFTTTAAAWLAHIALTSPVATWIGLVLLLLTVIVHLVAAHRPFPAGLTFATLLLLVGGFFALVQGRLLASDQMSGHVLGEAALESSLGSLATLVLPLLMLVGFDIAGFAVRAATWTAAFAQRMMPVVLLYIVLGLSIVALMLVTLQSILSLPSWGKLIDLMSGLAGASVLVLGLLLLWRVADRRAAGAGVRDAEVFTQAAGRAAALFIVAYFLPYLVAFVAYQLGQVVQVYALQAGGALQLVGAALLAAGNLTSSLVRQRADLWMAVVLGALVITAAYLLVKRRSTPALFIGAVGLHGLWTRLTQDDGLLAFFYWDGQDPVVLGWLAVVAVVALNWWRRSILDQARVVRLLFAVCLLALVRQTGFIGDPFSPFLGFTGIGLVAFGLAWEMLTAGSWINQDGRWLPHSSRLFLYVGYMLLTITLVNWAVASHDLAGVNLFTGEASMAGFSFLGVPYLFALIPITLFAPHANNATDYRR